MEYRVVIVQSEHGFSVSCPALRGCHSHGDTHAEAVDNIKIAIREWLDAEADEHRVFSVHEELVTV